MKAIRVQEFGGPEKLVLEDVETPEPDQDQILVQILAAGVNPVDTYIRSGAYARKPALPYTPGTDAAGIVAATGKGVTRFKVGERVYIYGSLTGTYSEYALCRESDLHPLPKSISYAQGAALGVPYGTAYRAIFHKAHAQAGESMLVHGASGGVGIAALQLAHAAGLQVIGTAGTERGLALAAENGAHHVLDHNAPDLAERVLKLTDGRGVNMILEMLANKNIPQDLSMVSANGRVIVIGNRGAIEVNFRDAMARDASIIGMLLFNTTPQELTAIHAAIVAGLETGIIKPVIGQEFPLGEASRAHEAVLRPGSYGKIVLVP